MNPSTALSIKPPVAYTDAAIKAGIAHEAANGPAHVRIRALGMMARITGLFEQGKQLAKQLAQGAQQNGQQVADQATDKLHAGYARVTELMNGAKPTPEELAETALHFSGRSEEEDETHDTEQDDEPP